MLPSLTRRQICDRENLMTGDMEPLKAFLCVKDYNGVVENVNLADWWLWPVLVTLESETMDREQKRRGWQLRQQVILSL